MDLSLLANLTIEIKAAIEAAIPDVKAKEPTRLRADSRFMCMPVLRVTEEGQVYFVSISETSY